MKNKKLIIIMGTIIVILAGLIAFLILKPEDKKEEVLSPTADSLRFKEEYESLNDTVRESDGATYNNVFVDEVNPIKYVDTKEALNILKNETAVIYVGANWCPWCRNIVDILFTAAKDRNIKTIYYLDLDDEKSTFEVKDKKLVQTKKGTDSYYELLDFLSDELKDYSITDNNKTYDTGEKRIYMPFVIVCKDGKVVDTHTGSVTLEEGQTKYDAFTDAQRNEVYNKYTDMMKKILPKGSCDDNCD